MIRLTTAQIVHALERQLGIVALAASDLGISRQALQQRINRSAVLRAAIRTIHETSLDAAEACLMNQVLKLKDPAQIRFYLSCKGKHRDWTTRSEVTGRNGEAIDIKSSIEGLSDEQAALLERLIQTGGSKS